MYCHAGMMKCVLGWCLPEDYQKLESPQRDSAVHVSINVEILDILSVNDKEFSITMSMYFRCIKSTNHRLFYPIFILIQCPVAREQNSDR